jgi:hypothetical protein
MAERPIGDRGTIRITHSLPLFQRSDHGRLRHSATTGDLAQAQALRRAQLPNEISAALHVSPMQPTTTLSDGSLANLP